MPEELKPCPICGENMNLMVMKNNHPIAADKPYYIQCGNGCLCAGPTASATADAAIAAWNSLPRAPHLTHNDADCKGCPERRPGLAWTTEPPTVSGNYWWICGQEQPDEPQMVNVVLSEGRFHFFFHYSEGPFFHECDSCRWAGPIPGPEEAV